MNNDLLKSTYFPLLISAKKCLKIKDFYSAKNKILAAIQVCFDKPEAYNLLGIYYELKNNNHLAVKYFRIAYFYDQSFKPASLNLERIVENTGKEIDYGV